VAGFKITTKGGDKGTTSLGNGERVQKDDTRVELYGTLDECQAALGLARSFCTHEDLAKEIYFIEDYLYKAMGYFACCDMPGPDPDLFEALTEKLSAGVCEEMAFVRPGDTSCGAALHLARSIARRAERIATPLFNEKKITDKAYVFLNRLSDALFILALRVDSADKYKKGNI
jgi:cob(I)alamin adenosyltransferase